MARRRARVQCRERCQIPRSWLWDSVQWNRKSPDLGLERLRLRTTETSQHDATRKGGGGEGHACIWTWPRLARTCALACACISPGACGGLRAVRPQGMLAAS